MNTFSFNRFALTLRYLGMVRWRLYVNCLVVPLLACAAMLIVSGNFWSPFHQNLSASKGVFAFFLLLGSTFFCVRAIIPKDVRSSEYSQFLALPASNLEKFAASIVMRVVVPLLCATVGYYVAVLVVNPMAFWRVFSRSLLNINGVNILDSLPPSFSPALSIGIALLPSALIFFHLAFFLFSGVFFSRLKWILCSLIQFLLWSFVVSAVAWVDNVVDFDEYMVNYTALVWWVDSILFAVGALLVLGAYKVFCRTQSVMGRFLTI